MHVYVLLMKSRGSLQIFLLISDLLLVFRFKKSYLISLRTLAVETLHKFSCLTLLIHSRPTDSWCVL